MQASRCSTTRQGGLQGDETTQALNVGADEASLKVQLKLQLYRIYTSVSRQRGWFKMHETNVRTLVETAEMLRARFFPNEQSLLERREDVNMDTMTASFSPTLAFIEGEKSTDVTAQTAIDGMHSSFDDYGLQMINKSMPIDTLRPRVSETPPRANAECAPPLQQPPAIMSLYGDGVVSCNSDYGDFDALRRIVPEYLLQLTPEWIHRRLWGEVDVSVSGRISGGKILPQEATAALLALLLPVIQALSDIVDVARWSSVAGDFPAGVSVVGSAVSFSTLSAGSRHLFYLFHETLCCLSLHAVRSTVRSRDEAVEPQLQMSSDERARAAVIFARLFNQRDNRAMLFQLLCAEDVDGACDHLRRVEAAATVGRGKEKGQSPSAAAVLPCLVVGEAFDFFAVHYLGC